MTLDTCNGVVGVSAVNLGLNKRMGSFVALFDCVFNNIMAPFSKGESWINAGERTTPSKAVEDRVTGLCYHTFKNIVIMDGISLIKMNLKRRKLLVMFRSHTVGL